MTQIDWSKKPEGYPLWLKDLNPCMGGDMSGWHRDDGDKYTDESGLHWKKCNPYDYIVYSEPQTSWAGEGLPPVGTVCEAMVSPGEWAKVEVLAHGIEDDDEVAVLQAGPRIITKTFMGIRPIRTPEQIAAEDRLASAYAMCGIAKSLTNVDAALLYDAGLRFEVKP